MKRLLSLFLVVFALFSIDLKADFGFPEIVRIIGEQNLKAAVGSFHKGTVASFFAAVCVYAGGIFARESDKLIFLKTGDGLIYLSVSCFAASVVSLGTLYHGTRKKLCTKIF